MIGQWKIPKPLLLVNYLVKNQIFASLFSVCQHVHNRWSCMLHAWFVKENARMWLFVINTHTRMLLVLYMMVFSTNIPYREWLLYGCYTDLEFTQGHLKQSHDGIPYSEETLRLIICWSLEQEVKSWKILNHKVMIPQ